MDPVVILNKHINKDIPSTAVLIDRTTPWGNPFKIGDSPKGKRITREDSLVMFRKYLDENPLLVAKAKIYLRGHDLVCWCHPKACHGDIWLEYIYKD
jgi:hypothetical protein